MMVTASLPWPTELADIFPRHVDAKLRGFATHAQPGDPRTHGPSPSIPRAMHSPSNRKRLAKTAQTVVCKELLTLHRVRCGVEAITEVSTTLRDHLSSALLSRVPRSIADDYDSIGFDAAESFAQRSLVIFRVMKRGIEECYLELFIVEWKTIQLGLKARDA